ncbi:unnamed protein product [Sphagnum troendelagicum]|uniref:NIF system FeS cluster assembly NifU C-terminal domain-containing protein n=1 Tax=Sphagnum troendelagicum TaxID=128251 RepID=A0ABP0U322_9BRYO
MEVVVAVNGSSSVSPLSIPSSCVSSSAAESCNKKSPNVCVGENNRLGKKPSWSALVFSSRRDRRGMMGMKHSRERVIGVAFAVASDPQLQGLSGVVVTDDAVPEGHRGLHGFLYGDAGADVHSSGSKEFTGREGEDDGDAILVFEDYILPRESFKFAGVLAVYDTRQLLQYVGYSRNVVLTLKTLRGRVGMERCCSVRVKLFTEASLITRAKLEEEKQRWLDAVGFIPLGNSSEKELWEGGGGNSSLGVMSEIQRKEYEEKKLKMRKAMGENLFDAVEEEDDDARTRRLKFLRATEGDDWSSVIDGQTKETYETPISTTENITISSATKGSSLTNGATTVAEEPAAEVVSPFSNPAAAQPSTGGTGGLYSAESYELTLKNVDMVLEEVRPYLVADGGNVEVVGVADGVISLRLQGACGTCPSSTTTMKMGIERVLKEKFGAAMKEIIQVDKQDIGASVSAVNAHIEILRPAIRNYGGIVEVISVDTTSGECQVQFKGPAPIGMGIQAAIKDKFPDIKSVVLLAAP